MNDATSKSSHNDRKQISGVGYGKHHTEDECAIELLQTKEVMNLEDLTSKLPN